MMHIKTLHWKQYLNKEKVLKNAVEIRNWFCAVTWETNKMKKTYFGEMLICLLNLCTFMVRTSGLDTFQTWTFDLKEIIAKTSDPKKLKMDLYVERISRGVYAISGEILFNFDFVEGDANHIEVKVFRSIRGDGDFKILPFKVPSTHYVNAFNNYYRGDYVEVLKECSNLPVIELPFSPPVEKKLYKLNSCQFSQDDFPNYLQEGFYKVVLLGSGEVDWELSIITEVMSNI